MNRPENVQWEFGSFRLDAAQRLLFREEELVPLSRKAIEILAILVERHGQLVEKEELMRLVWPDSFVEESNLAVHISQLRKTLGEANGENRIETIPRRGYRFLGAVERRAEAGEAAHSGSEAGILKEDEASGPPIVAESGAGGAGDTAADGGGKEAEARTSRRWLRTAAGLATVLAIGLGVWAAVRIRGRHLVSDRAPGAATGAGVKNSIVLGPIANNTGDAVFDTTLREAMVIELEQSPVLSLIPEERLQQSLKLMGKPPETPITADLARELCERTGGSAVLDGWIARLGVQYVIGVRAVNCRTGDHLADLQTTASGKDLVLKAVGDMTGQLRTKLGEGLSTVQKFDTPIEEATTSSLEALQAYSMGRELMVQKGESPACVPFFQKAIRLDPEFAVAYAALGNAYSNLNETGLAAENIRKAYELRSKVSEHERLYIESHYYQFVTGDLTKASRVYETWATTYPNDQAPRTNLAVIYSDLGKFDQSLEQAKEAVRIAAHDRQSYANLVDAYLLLNRTSEANAIAQQALQQNMDSSNLRLYLYDVAFLEQDASAMERQMTWASGEPGVEDAFLNDDADVLAVEGKLAEARAKTARAVEAAKRADEKETAAGYDLDEAQREAAFGNAAEAVKAAEAALALAGDRDTKFGVGVALALAGDTKKAETLSAQMEKDFPDDTIVQDVYLPTIRGEIAVKEKDPSRAVKTLETATPYELSISGGLLPVFVRGLAYLEARDGRSAAAEFQKLIDHPGIVLNAPIAPVARLELARAYLAENDRVRAQAAYEDFLNRWKDADAEIPILREAQEEYAKAFKTAGK